MEGSIPEDTPDEDLRARPDSAPLGFDFWFTPFDAELHLPPYLVEGYEELDEDEDDDFEDDDLEDDEQQQEHHQH